MPDNAHPPVVKRAFAAFVAVSIVFAVLAALAIVPTPARAAVNCTTKVYPPVFFYDASGTMLYNADVTCNQRVDLLAIRICAQLRGTDGVYRDIECQSGNEARSSGMGDAFFRDCTRGRRYRTTGFHTWVNNSNNGSDSVSVKSSSAVCEY